MGKDAIVRKANKAHDRTMKSNYDDGIHQVKVRMFQYKSKDAYDAAIWYSTRLCEIQIGENRFEREEELMVYLFDRSLEGWSVERLSDSKNTFTVDLRKGISKWEGKEPTYSMRTNIDADVVEAISNICPFKDERDVFSKFWFARD